MRSFVVVAAALAALAGCKATPLAVELQTSAEAAAPEQVEGQALRIVTASARLEDGALEISARVSRPSYGHRWIAQVYVDTDRDPATGYGFRGVERVGRLVETNDAGVFPVREASAQGGFQDGTVTGQGVFRANGTNISIEIPTAALGDVDAGVTLLVTVFGIEDGQDTGEFHDWYVSVPGSSTTTRGPVSHRQE